VSKSSYWFQLTPVVRNFSSGSSATNSNSIAPSFSTMVVMAHSPPPWRMMQVLEPGRASTTTHLLAVLQSKGYPTSHVERTNTLHFCPAHRKRLLQNIAAPYLPADTPPCARTRSARERPGCLSWRASSRL